MLTCNATCRRWSLSFLMAAVLTGCGPIPFADPAGGDAGQPAPLDGGGGGNTNTNTNGNENVNANGNTTVPPLTDCHRFPVFGDGLAPSATLWVDGDAAAGGDGTVDRPFASLVEASHAATPGTEIRIDGVVHGDQIVSLSGTGTAPIWVRGEPGAEIRGLFMLHASSSVIVEDLEFSESRDHGVHVIESDHVVLRRLNVHDSTQDCVKGYHCQELYLLDSELHHPGTQPSEAAIQRRSILTWIGVHGGHILRNHLHDGPDQMLVLKGGTADVLVAFNDIHGQYGNDKGALQLGNATGPQYFDPLDADYEGLRLVAFANLIHDVGAMVFTFMGCRDCAGVHNTIFNTDSHLLMRFLAGYAGQDSGTSSSLTSGCRFTGNIVVGGTSDGATINANAQNLGPGNSVDHNVFLKPGSVNWWGDIPQDLDTSTYAQDPLLAADGTPANTALVSGRGATDLAALPFGELFVSDQRGRCVSLPLDIGALSVP